MANGPSYSDEKAKNSDWQEWFKEWRDFVQAVIAPVPIFFFVSTIALIAVTAFQSDPILIVIFTALSSISGGLLGTAVWERWNSIRGKSILVNKGKSAIRSLKLLLRNLNACERRVKEYFSRLPKGDQNGSVISTWLEEEVQRLAAVQEEVIDSIENWTDIIPEADVRTQLTPYRNLLVDMEQLQREKAEVESQLEKVSTDEREKRQALEKQLKVKNEEVANVREQLEAERRRIGETVISGVPISSGIRLTDPPFGPFEAGFSAKKILLSDLLNFGVPKCEECGRSGVGLAMIGDKCSSCATKEAIKPPPEKKVKKSESQE